MLDWKKNEYKKNFVRILLLGLILRILFSIVLGLGNQEEWEYGAIADNLVKGKSYSFYYFDAGDLAYAYKNDVTPSPSAYMPPGYVLVLAGFKLISSGLAYSILVFCFNVALFSFTLLYLFKLTGKLFGEKVALISILAYSIVPEFIYTTYSIGTTQVYHLLLVMIFYYSLKTVSSKSYVLPIIFGVAIMFRFEIALLLVFIAAILLFRKEYKKTILLIVIPTIFLSPWAIRNYVVFNEFIPFSTSGGLNLYRGNNAIEIGGWHNVHTLSKIHSFSGDTSKIELFLNKMYKEEAFDYLNGDIGEVATNFGKKIFYFWAFNPNEGKFDIVAYGIPWAIMLFFAIFGFVKSENKSSILCAILLYHTAVAAVFVPLLRYQTMMKVALLPYLGYGIYSLFKSRFK